MHASAPRAFPNEPFRCSRTSGRPLRSPRNYRQQPCDLRTPSARRLADRCALRTTIDSSRATSALLLLDMANMRHRLIDAPLAPPSACQPSHPAGATAACDARLTVVLCLCITSVLYLLRLLMANPHNSAELRHVPPCPNSAATPPRRFTASPSWRRAAAPCRPSLLSRPRPADTITTVLH